MDAVCWTVIGALATAVAGVSGFAAKVYGDLKDARAELSASQNARVAVAEAHQRELETLKEMLKRKKKGGPP